jgi:hypothetical protein
MIVYIDQIYIKTVFVVFTLELVALLSLVVPHYHDRSMPMADINTHTSSPAYLCASFRMAKAWPTRGALSSLSIFIASLVYGHQGCCIKINVLPLHKVDFFRSQED